MRRRLALLVAALAVPAALLSLPAQAGNGNGAGAYIVVLKDAVDPAAVANMHSNKYGAKVDAVWGHALHGYAAVIPNDRVAELRADANVKYVVADGEATINAQTIPYGISLVNATSSSTAAGNGSGTVSGVDVYVIDTGVDTAHPDLNVVQYASFAKGGGRGGDCNGHGTHVAGTIAAKDDTQGVVGVAPGAAIHAVRVLNCQGSGQWSWIINGINWVTANHAARSVANMSLGGPVNQAVDDAVRNSANAGVFYAVAAGNDGANACNQTPARAGAGSNNGIATVAAIDSTSREASWSNYGSCVDIWAPGVNVYSTWTGGGYNTISGTSMASPHVAGGGALYLSHGGASAAAVEAALTSAATHTGISSKDGREITRENVGGF
ncbi:MAG: S8 family peptidase [Gaiellaceae bacterium]